MFHAVAGDERDPPPLDRADGGGCRGRAVGRLDGDLFDVFKEGIEPGPAEDADPDGVAGQLDRAQADLSFLLPGEAFSFGFEGSAFLVLSDEVAVTPASPVTGSPLSFAFEPLRESVA